MMKAEAKSARTMVTDDKRPQLASLASGVLVAYAITVIVFIVYAMLITYTTMSEQNIPLVVTATTLISVVVAGFDSARGADQKGWLWGIGAGLIYAVILVLLMTWINKGFPANTRTITLIVLSLAGGGLGGVLGINFKK